MERRNFLKATTLGLGAGILGSNLSKGKDRPTSEKKTAHLNGGRVLAVGFDGSRHAGAQVSVNSSVFTEIDLKTGKAVTQQLIPVPKLHKAIGIGEDSTVLVPLNGEQCMVHGKGGSLKELKAPQDFRFAGHGLTSPAGDLLFLSLRRRREQGPKDFGAMWVIALPSLKPVALWSTGGVRPHDLAWCGRNLAISHYGDYAHPISGAAGRRPCLTVLDPETGEVIKTIDTPEYGSLTHIASDGTSRVLGVASQFYGFDDAGRQALARDYPDFDISLSPAERWEGRIAPPLPVLMIDTAKGTVKEIMGEPLKQRRPQSVLYHGGSDSFWVTFAFSDMLAKIDRLSGAITYKSGFDLGLGWVRGLCQLGNSDYLAVSGEMEGIGIIDANSFALIERVACQLFDNPHLTFRV